MNENAVPEPPPPSGKSTGKKWAIGCGIGCLILLILAGILGAAAARGVKKAVMEMEPKVMAQLEEAVATVEKMSSEFEAKGFQAVRQPAIDVNEEVHGPKVYVGQMVRIFARCDDDVAIAAPMAEVHSEVTGDLYFRGQMLTLHPGAVVGGNLDVEAQMLQVNGATVLGEITGSHQLIDNGMKRQRE